MFKIHEVREMIKLIDQSSITHFELENEGDKIVIRKEAAKVEAVQVSKQETVIQPVLAEQQLITPAAQPVATPVVNEQKQVEVVQNTSAVSEEDENLHKIISPMVGTFYQAPSPESPPYVKVGDQVGEETVVCIVEAMKLMNEIEAEIQGKIVKVLVENGQLVEYGQPLFLVKPE